ncbi:nitroreductase / dihydropteridine reductase [Phycisphaerales bacterium]|nr:nitroreductase / dihydropteridine reductase [Phycisphaerales bacterium]
MKPVDPSALLDNLSWRYAVKKFDSTRKIPDDQWAAIERAIILAPSSFGLQPWKFMVIADQALRTTLRVASWNQSQITDASHLVVFARRAEMTARDVDRHIDRIIAIRNTPREVLAELRTMMLGAFSAPGFDVNAWAARQVYLALGFFLYTAAQMGVDACPMEGIDAARYDEILNLSAQGYRTTVVATAGFRASDDWLAPLAKVRFPAEEVIERR